MAMITFSSLFRMPIALYSYVFPVISLNMTRDVALQSMGEIITMITGRDSPKEKLLLQKVTILQRNLVS